MITTMARDRLIASAELMQLLGVNRARAYQLSQRADFPAPYDPALSVRVWALADVQRWADERGRTLLPLDASHDSTGGA